MISSRQFCEAENYFESVKGFLVFSSNVANYVHLGESSTSAKTRYVVFASGLVHNRCMPIILLTTEILAPIETVFDLARSVDLHMKSTAATRERAIAGKTSGLIGPGESVTWEATHFWVRQKLSVTITQFERPYHFRDSMVSGVFARFDHDHHFESHGNKTLMTDCLDFTSPCGLIGRLADHLFVTRHLRRLLSARNLCIKKFAESGQSSRFFRDQAN